MLKVSVKQTGFEALDRFPDAINEIVRQTALEAESTMKKPGMAPYLTGNLRRSIIAVGDKARWQTAPHTVYAAIRNRISSSPHYIERTTRQTLKDIPTIMKLVFKKFGIGV